MVAKINRVPCRVLVFPGFPTAAIREIKTGQVSNSLDSDLDATHVGKHDGKRCMIIVNLAKVKRSSRCWPGDCRQRLFNELLSTMVHECTHHWVRGHGNRWKSRCANLAHMWELKLTDCWP